MKKRNGSQSGPFSSMHMAHQNHASARPSVPQGRFGSAHSGLRPAAAEIAGVEELLLASRRRTVSRGGVRERVFMNVQERMGVPVLLREAKRAATPQEDVASTLWRRIHAAIEPLGEMSLWERLRSAVAPSEGLSSLVWGRLLLRFQPASARVGISWPIKWVAAFSLVLLAVRLTPVLLAPPTIAESSVMAFATEGQVSVLIGGLWQPMGPGEQLRLHAGTLLRTGEGQATLMMHDDAVVRLAPGTTIAFNDDTDRPAKPAHTPTIALQQGKIWVLGLVPKHLDGITVGTSQARVVIHEGSVSIADGREVTVEAWDRGVAVERRTSKMPLVAGNRLTLRTGVVPSLQRIDPSEYRDTWANANLDRDAVHQREIAQMQQERRAAAAGILPDSGLYAAKRFAEEVDVAFTFGHDAKAKKRIAQANTRLNEAAALIGQGNDDQAQAPLREFKETVLSVASGSGGRTAVNSLLEQEVIVVAMADTSAPLPGDESHALKQAVYETVDALPDTLAKPDTEGAAVLDELAVIRRHVEDGDIQAATLQLTRLEESLSSLDDVSSRLAPDVRNEVEAALIAITSVVEETDTDTAAPAEATQPQVSRVAPPLRPSQPVRRPLTQEEIRAKALQIRADTLKFELPNSQSNALRELMDNLEDPGPVLREVQHLFLQDELADPTRSNALSQRVRRKIQQVNRETREEMEAQ